MLKSKYSYSSKPFVPMYTENSPLQQQQQLLDLEIGLSGRRPPRKFKRSGLPRMLQRLQHRHKVSTLFILIGSLCTAVCILYLIGIVYKSLLAASAPSLPLPYHPYPYRKLQNLVMVAGHAVFTSTGCDKVDMEGSWFLESYQKHPGQALTFINHIRAGVESAASDAKALLLFSGGETRKDAGPRSEAQSYWSVAESSNWFGSKQEVRWKALTEEHARDSFENLLFSVCRFKELTGKYPWNITVVSYDFKENRFANLHRLALKFPASRFFYKGTPASPTAAAAAAKGEASVQVQFQEDPYGCVGSLHTKRAARDPFVRTIPYPAGCPELSELFSYCGTSIFPGSLPWEPSSTIL
ncbi:hypothetical protein GOP47_0009715 [Adiantum capillus-veneris]|uniref:DUF218 domain-containing protein n=1 Tax=Adiantum capillus-veneris TaxID=13818 RepID=A0A9D4ZHH1_ADICA|nr:hypothetical protein GOP47_0009715 [Adiantum capillus-veneris]